MSVLISVVVFGCQSERPIESASSVSPNAASKEFSKTAGSRVTSSERGTNEPEMKTGRQGDRTATTGETASDIRFIKLGDDVVPAVVPENGARHGFATILESLGSGVGVLDVDADGWEDLVIGGGGDLFEKQVSGHPLACLRNIKHSFVDVTTQAVLDQKSLYSHGITVSDFNNDGFSDFLVTGYQGLRLYENLSDGTFEDVTATSLLNAPRWNASAAWGDINQDGIPDLFVTGYVDWSFENDPPCYAADGQTRDNCSPKLFNAVPDALFFGSGDGTFHEATQKFGVRADGKALGVVIADLDLDGFSDIYVGNDVMMNFLYRNEAGQTFSDHSISSGSGVSSRGSPDASMGVEAADFNLDGLPDLWAANFEMESFALYQNQGRMLFRHVSEVTSISAIGDQFVGWGSAFCDFENDGDEDVCICNGNVVQFPVHSPWKQRMVLLENRSAEYFTDETQAACPDMMVPRHGRGLASFDWNLDGKLDLVISPIHSRAEVYENCSPSQNNWLALKLSGVTSARHCVGALVTLETSQRKRIRLQKGGGSYLSSSSPSLHFGVPEDEQVTRLTVRWPSGSETTIEQPPMKTTVILREPRKANDSEYWTSPVQ
jgi:hypothetical protein